MRAIWYDQQGSAADVLTHGEIETPTAGAGEYLIRLHHSGVNPSDVKSRRGPRAMPFNRIIPHSDGAGVIEAVGPNGDKSVIGKRVYIRNGQWQRPFGSAAEYIALNEDLVHDLPDNVGFDAGAGLGIPALTAAYTVLKDGAVDGQTMVVHGGGGTVARLAIQIAIDAGANVIATTKGNADDLSDLGCSHVFDYSDPDLAAQIIGVAKDGVARVVDAEIGVNLATDIEITASKGIIVGYGTSLEMTPSLPFIPMMFKNITLSSILVYLLEADEAAAYAAIIHDMLTHGRLDVPIAGVFDMKDCVAAHEMVEAGARSGAVLLSCT
ncbi:NADPH:quinone reductase [Alphaproteobacteria bacterium]|nr:NADPH:quinone reductase [Alphaproteobacteria bacterium]